MTRAIWIRTVAALQERQKAQQRLEQSKENWEIAKSTRDERVVAHDEAQQSAAEQHPVSLPEEVWKSLHGLYEDRRRAEEQFELLDRQRRKDADLAKKLEDRVLELALEAYGSGGELPFSKPAQKGDEDQPGWHSVQLSDFMGPINSAPFEQVGITTLREAFERLAEKGALKLSVEGGKLTQAQADYFRSVVIQRLNAFGVEHRFGKPGAVEIPDVAKKTKPKVEPEAEEPHEVDQDGEGASDQVAAAPAAEPPAVVGKNGKGKKQPVQPDDAPSVTAYWRGRDVKHLTDHGVSPRTIEALRGAKLKTLGDIESAQQRDPLSVKGWLTSLSKSITPGDEMLLAGLIAQFQRPPGPTSVPAPT